MMLQVSVYPWRYSDGSLEIRVDVESNAQRYEHREIVYQDDFHSVLDLVLDHAKEAIKRLAEEAAP